MNRLLGIEGLLLRLKEEDTGMCPEDNKAILKYILELQDKLSRRNMLAKNLRKQIGELKKYRELAGDLSALLGRLGYDLKGNKIR